MIFSVTSLSAKARFLLAQNFYSPFTDSAQNVGYLPRAFSMASAERAYYHLAPTLLGNEVTATLVTVEVIGKGDKGVEVFKCRSHSLKVFTSYLYLKTMGIFQKVQRFSRWTSMFYGIIGVIRYILPFHSAFN